MALRVPVQRSSCGGGQGAGVLRPLPEALVRFDEPDALVVEVCAESTEREGQGRSGDGEDDGSGGTGAEAVSIWGWALVDWFCLGL